MAVQLQTPAYAATLARTLDWMQTQVPDRYWETSDAERILQLVYATSSSTPVRFEPPALPWLEAATARLTDLDQENDACLREHGVLVEESDLFQLT